MFTLKNILTIAVTLILFAQFSHSQSTVWTEVDKIVASDRQEDAQFGGLGNGSKVVSMYGDYAVVGAEKNDHSGLNDAGAAYVYKKNATGGWSFVQKLVASNPQANSFFGSSVAISEYEDFIVVGSPNYDSPSITATGSPLSQSGTAYLFQRNAFGAWVQVQQLYPDYADREAFAHFGNSVDITTRRVIIGAFREAQDPNLPTLGQSGAAYLFERSGIANSWNLIQKLTASDRGVNNRFGSAVAISLNYAVVGAPGNGLDVNGNNPITSSGAAYIFEKNGSIPWTEVNKITSTDRNASEFFGGSVDIDDRFIIVGATGDNTDANGNNIVHLAGSAFTYYKNGIAGSWGLQGKIIANDRQQNDFFGLCVGIDKMGYAVVGTYLEDHDENGANFLNRTGSAYVYKYDNSSVPLWTQHQKIVASDRSAFDEFGASVAIDKEVILVSARAEDHDANGANFIAEAGSAYFYELLDGTVPFTSKSENNAVFEILDNKSEMIVAPNPSLGQARLYLPDFTENRAYTLVVYDPAGRVIIDDVVSNNDYQLNLEEHENGMYLIQVNDGEQIYRLKLMLSK